jgi:hypothetical protein
LRLDTGTLLLYSRKDPLLSQVLQLWQCTISSFSVSELLLFFFFLVSPPTLMYTVCKDGQQICLNLPWSCTFS